MALFKTLQKPHFSTVNLVLPLVIASAVFLLSCSSSKDSTETTSALLDKTSSEGSLCNSSSEQDGGNAIDPETSNPTQQDAVDCSELPFAIDVVASWLNYADAADHENTWKQSSEFFQSAVEIDDWRQSLKAARAPLGPLLSRTISSVEALENPAGAPDGNYVKILFSSSFKNKKSAQETLTLVEEEKDQWRTVGYFIK